MHPVTQRRRSLRSMRIVHHHGKAARRQFAANHPVVAANFFGTVAEINCCGLIQSRQRICACTIFGNQLVTRKPDRFAKSVIEFQDFTREQCGIYRRIQIQSRIGGLKILQILYLVGTQRTYGLREIQLLIHIGQQPVETRDDDCRRPLARSNSEHSEFRREQICIFLCLTDIGVNSFDERFDDGLAVRVVPIEFLLQISAKHEKPRADVSLEFLSPQDLRHSPSGLPPPNFKLKEAIARHVVTLSEKQIVLVLRIDVRNAPTVRENLYRLTQAGKLEGLGLRRRARRYRSRRHYREQRQRYDYVFLDHGSLRAEGFGFVSAQSQSTSSNAVATSFQRAS